MENLRGAMMFRKFRMEIFHERNLSEILWRQKLLILESIFNGFQKHLNYCATSE